MALLEVGRRGRASPVWVHNLEIYIIYQQKFVAHLTVLPIDITVVSSFIKLERYFPNLPLSLRQRAEGQ